MLNYNSNYYKPFWDIRWKVTGYFLKDISDWTAKSFHVFPNSSAINLVNCLLLAKKDKNECVLYWVTTNLSDVQIFLHGNKTPSCFYQSLPDCNLRLLKYITTVVIMPVNCRTSYRVSTVGIAHHLPVRGMATERVEQCFGSIWNCSMFAPPTL